MSPASKSKSKDKRTAGKEPQKPSTKTTTANIGGSSISASGYNPLLGTFHTLDTAPPLHTTEDHSGNSVEYDSVSNNGSWSGESEDHKDKMTQIPSRHETIPGVDNDKREKIRQKNEKKHQRQKERRAQELHERCSGYLMSRKLEALAQQLVSMGFSSERATMALILNEGRVEQSVAWLFEGGEDGDSQRDQNTLDGGGNLKIDISEELAQITEMEIKFKCSKQEVERAVVACEGDLEQAAETLKAQKQETPAVPPKLEEPGDSSSTIVNNNKISVAMNQNSSRTQSKAIPINPKTDDKDFNYTKVSGEAGVKNVHLLKKVPPLQQNATVSVEKRWPVGGSNPSLASPLQAAPPPAKTESRYGTTVATELKNLQLGSVREPVIVMQRPKSSVSSSSSTSAASNVDWHPNVVDPIMNPNHNSNAFSHVPTTTRSFNVNTQLYEHFHYHQQQQQQQQQTNPQYTAIGGPFDPFFSQQGPMNHFNSSGIWNRMMGTTTTTTTTPTLAAASSLGLFSGLGSNGSSGPSSPVDWNAGDSLQFDYTNIDWSLDPMPNNNNNNQSSSRLNGMWSNGGVSMGARVGNGVGNNPEGVVVGPEGSGSGSREWSSPFEEKELFSFPRQFVSSPSL